MVRDLDFKDAKPEFDQYYPWLKRRDKAAEEEEPGSFVTISREYGCEGYALSLRLRELLNEQFKENQWHLFTHQMMELMAADDKMSADMVHKALESRYSFTRWFLDGIVPDYLQSPQLQVFDRMKKLVVNMAARGNCIILGGGAEILTERLSPKLFNGLHVRLVADREWRVKHVMGFFGQERGEAEKHLDKHQSERDRFIKDLTMREAGDPCLYHLTLNNGKLGVDSMARLIIEQMRLAGMFKE